jgi:hypothetical protein
MGEGYDDGKIECGPDGLHIRGYYFPWGSKRIPYASIRGVQRVDIGAFTGRGRIWGTANPRYWANFDPGRPRKKVGLILDLGKAVKPFVTPDDPDAVEAIIRQRAELGPSATDSARGPVI